MPSRQASPYAVEDQYRRCRRQQFGHQFGSHLTDMSSIRCSVNINHAFYWNKPNGWMDVDPGHNILLAVGTLARVPQGSDQLTAAVCIAAGNEGQARLIQQFYELVVILGELGIKPAVGVNKGLPARRRQILEQPHEANQEWVRNGMAPPMDAAPVFTGHYAQTFVGQGLAKFST